MHHWNLLSHLSGIRIEGPDARAFAHAQFTTAFNDETAPGWRPTAWCNPKGRVITVLLARVSESAVDLIAPAEQLDLIGKRLPMFAIGRKVRLENGLSVAGCLGNCGQPEHQLELDRERCLDLDRPELEPDRQFISEWITRDIRAGLAWLSQARSEHFLPQALGLEDLDGLSYTKGCYPGQEVVARVHYLGRSKEKLSGIEFDDVVDVSNQDLFNAQGDRVGKVLESVNTDSGTVGLAVVGIADSLAAAVYCNGHEGRLREPAALC
jgi:folate-binding protein YgfZ